MANPEKRTDEGAPEPEIEGTDALNISGEPNTPIENTPEWAPKDRTGRVSKTKVGEKKEKSNENIIKPEAPDTKSVQEEGTPIEKEVKKKTTRSKKLKAPKPLKGGVDEGGNGLKDLDPLKFETIVEQKESTEKAPQEAGGENSQEGPETKPEENPYAQMTLDQLDNLPGTDDLSSEQGQKFMDAWNAAKKASMEYGSKKRKTYAENPPTEKPKLVDTKPIPEMTDQEAIDVVNALSDERERIKKSGETLDPKVQQRLEEALDRVFPKSKKEKEADKKKENPPTEKPKLVDTKPIPEMTDQEAIDVVNALSDERERIKKSGETLDPKVQQRLEEALDRVFPKSKKEREADKKVELKDTFKEASAEDKNKILFESAMKRMTEDGGGFTNEEFIGLSEEQKVAIAIAKSNSLKTKKKTEAKAIEEKKENPKEKYSEKSDDDLIKEGWRIIDPDELELYDDGIVDAEYIKRGGKKWRILRPKKSLNAEEKDPNDMSEEELSRDGWKELKEGDPKLQPQEPSVVIGDKTWVRRIEIAEKDESSVDLGKEASRPEKETIVSLEDTEVRGTAKKLIDKESIKKWNSLINEKRKIAEKVSSGELSREEGQAQRKDVSRRIVEQGWVMLGKDLDESRKKMEEREEEEWGKAINASYGSEDKYREKEKLNAEMVAINREADIKLKEILDKLPEKERKKYKEGLDFYGQSQKEVFEKTSDKNGQEGIVLSREAFCELSIMGYEPQNIKPANAWDVIKYSVGRGAIWDTIKDMAEGGELISIPFKDGSKRGSQVMTLKQAREFISEMENGFKKDASKKAETVLGELSQKRKESFREQSIEQVVLDREIKEIQELMIEKQENQRKEEADKITPEDRLKELNNLRKKWDDVNKIHKSLKSVAEKQKDKKKKIVPIKTESGNILNPTKDQDMLIDMQSKLTDEIIAIAEKLSGRDLKKYAIGKSGYKPGEQNNYKENLFKGYITEAVEGVYTEQIKKIENDSGKKVKVKSSLPKAIDSFAT